MELEFPTEINTVKFAPAACLRAADLKSEFSFANAFLIAAVGSRWYVFGIEITKENEYGRRLSNYASLRPAANAIGR